MDAESVSVECGVLVFIVVSSRHLSRECNLEDLTAERHVDGVYPAKCAHLSLETCHLLTVPWKLCLIWLFGFRLLVLPLFIRQLHFFIVVQGWLCRHVGFERLGFLFIRVLVFHVMLWVVLSLFIPAQHSFALFGLSLGPSTAAKPTSIISRPPCSHPPVQSSLSFQETSASGHCGCPSILRCHS